MQAREPRGIIIGEYHDQMAPKGYIIDGIKSGKFPKNTVLCLENVFSSAVPEYPYGYNDVAGEAVRGNQVDTLLGGECTLQGLVKCALDHNIPIRSIENRMLSKWYVADSEGITKRLNELNKHAVGVIGQVLEEGGFPVVFCGFAHAHKNANKYAVDGIQNSFPDFKLLHINDKRDKPSEKLPFCEVLDLEDPRTLLKKELVKKGIFNKHNNIEIHYLPYDESDPIQKDSKNNPYPIELGNQPWTKVKLYIEIHGEKTLTLLKKNLDKKNLSSSCRIIERENGVTVQADSIDVLRNLLIEKKPVIEKKPADEPMPQNENCRVM
jgi:hypothetical protein